MLNKKFLSVFAIIAVLCITVVFSLALATETRTVTVDALSGKILVFNLSEGLKFKGSISISGGSGNDVDFYVTDPHGSRVVSYGRVSQGTSFEFTAQLFGAYSFHFDNDFSLFSSKVVTLSYDIESPILPNSTDLQIWIVLVAVIIGLLLIGIGVFVLLRRNKSKPPNPPTS